MSPAEAASICKSYGHVGKGTCARCGARSFGKPVSEAVVMDGTGMETRPPQFGEAKGTPRHLVSIILRTIENAEKCGICASPAGEECVSQAARRMGSAVHAYGNRHPWYQGAR